MAFQRVKKILGISAVVIACGTVMFTFTSCGQANTQEPTEVVQEVETEQTEDNNGGNVIEDVDFNQEEVDAEEDREIVVYYEQSGTEADTLTIKGSDNQISYKVKPYIAPIFYDYMVNLGYNYEINEEEGTVSHDSVVVSDNYEITEDGKLLIRDLHFESSIPVVKYVRTGENDNEVEARYIGTAPLESNLVSGITFVCEKNEDGTYALTGLQGVFGEDISKLPVYEGEFISWATEPNEEGVFEAGDEIMISDGFNLYPWFKDNENGKTANADGTCVEGQLEVIDGMTVVRIIHINKLKTDKDGNQRVVADYGLAGLNTEKDTVKNTDGSTIDKDKVDKQQEDEKKKQDEEQAKKQAEEEAAKKKKQEESNKKSDNSSSSSKPSGNSGQSQNNVNNQDPYSDWESGWGGGSIDDNWGSVCDSSSHISGE